MFGSSPAGGTYTGSTYTGDGRSTGGATHTGKTSRPAPSSYQASGGFGGFGGGGGGGFNDPYGYGYVKPVPKVEMPAGEKDLVINTFKKWDVANQNYINKKELENVLVALGVDKKSTGAIFDQADWNKDGRIQYDEFVYWLYGGKAPRAVIDKALQQSFKVVVTELSVTHTADPKATVFVRWRDIFTQKVIVQSPPGPVAPAKIDLSHVDATKAPMVFDIPNDVKAVCVEVCSSGMFGTSVVGVAELQLGPVAAAMATGLGTVTNIEIPLCKEGNPRPGQKPQQIGKVSMALEEASEGGALWAKKIVGEWKKNGLPELATLVEVNAALETLVIEGEPMLENQIGQIADKLFQQAMEPYETWSNQQAEKELATIGDWTIKLKNAARKSASPGDVMARSIQTTKETLVAKVIASVMKSPTPDNAVRMKLALKFANRLDDQNYAIHDLERAFKDVLKFPENARMDDLMAAQDEDLVQLQPPNFGLSLDTDNPQPPKCDDHRRFEVRDDTARRTLRVLGSSESLHYTLGLTYEKLAPEHICNMVEPAFKMSDQVALLCKEIVCFRGEPDEKTLTLAQHMTARKRDFEALIGRFDVVAQPVIAEYDKDFEEIGPTAELPTGFFGGVCKDGRFQNDPATGLPVAGPLTKIGGKGWFWVIHAAAMNIGESARAEDFEEYSIASDTKYKGQWASSRALDETKYICDMTNLWRRSMEAAVHLGIQDMVMFPFGMGAFLRNLHQLDGYYSDATPRRRLRKSVASGLFESLAQMVAQSKNLRIHVCLVDTGLESRVNHNVFVEAAAELVKAQPHMAPLIKFHRNCDALELARNLASIDGPADKVRPVGMLNGANNKLLGNHWFAQGARSAIDENLHRRSSTMCIGSLLMNLATSPQDRSFQELAKNVKLLGGQVVDLAPFPVALGPSKFVGRIFARINIKCYGVLGTQLQKDKAAQVAPPPGPGVAVVDPTALDTIKNGPSRGGGVSKEIYRWLGIDSQPAFPQAVQDLKDQKEGNTQAKLNDYNGKLCIHAIGPNLREGRRCTPEQAIKELATVYAWIMIEFAQNPAAKLLRLCPVCSLGGAFGNELAAMDAQALSEGFSMLPAKYQDLVINSDGIELCIYSVDDLPKYAHAFRSLN